MSMLFTFFVTAYQYPNLQIIAILAIPTHQIIFFPGLFINAARVY